VRPHIVSVTCLLAWMSASPAWAGGFAAVVSPPRFELAAKSGATLRQVIEVTNRDVTPARYRIHTADFVLADDYTLTFRDELVWGSCRPWVAIERPLITLPAGATIRYRFEVQVPPDTAARECRFAIMIEGDEPSMAHAGAAQLPIVGRIGVIVYLRVGDVAPHIEVVGPLVVTFNGQRVPALRVRNEGTAHTRTSGFLTGKDATGKTYDFTPSDLPILPGDVRDVVFTPSVGNTAVATLAFPVSVRGTLEWDGQKVDLNETYR